LHHGSGYASIDDACVRSGLGAGLACTDVIRYRGVTSIDEEAVIRLAQFLQFHEGKAMIQISDIMTRDVRSVGPDDSLQRAAQAMDELNVGALPVLDGQNLIGMVTDRDITVRGVASDMSAASTPVSEVMSGNVQYCFEDEQIDDVMDKMRDVQIRRVPVMDRNNRLIGMVSLGDLATKTSADAEVKDTLENISSPSEPDRSTMH
jgi:CBS domain-containing protein